MAQYHLFVGLENRNDVFLRTFFHINAQGITETWYRCKKKAITHIRKDSLVYHHKAQHLQGHVMQSLSVWQVMVALAWDHHQQGWSPPLFLAYRLFEKIVMRNWNMKQKQYSGHTIESCELWYNSAKLRGSMIIPIVSLLLLIALIYLLHNQRKGQHLTMYASIHL